MSEMVERVARALCIADGKKPDEDWRYGDGVMLDVAVDEATAQRWRRYEKAARAAIEAMREPTEEMLNTFSSPEAWDSIDRGMAKAHHLMMIDAALKD